MLRNLALALTLVAGSAAAASPAFGRPVAFDPGRSRMTVHVYKQGVFSFLADDHVIDVPIASGSYDDDLRSVELNVDATKMRVLDPQLPSAKRAAVQGNMSGAAVLDATTFPTISFRSTHFEDAGANRWNVTGTLTLHGQTHPLTVHLTRIDPTHFSGSATVRQTDFGITPIEVAGGAVSVKDNVEIAFEVALAP